MPSATDRGRPTGNAPHERDQLDAAGLVNDKNERIEDNVMSQALPTIQVREDPTIPVLGGARIKGIIPPSIKPNADDVIYGVATWEKWGEKAHRFSIYVRGVSDGNTEISAPSAGKPSEKYKTLKLEFTRDPEIHLADPPSEWVYG
jgi:hypothetical protein